VAGEPALPFAATFANPASATFKGAAATFGGLLPVTYSETSPGSGVACDPGTAGARCDPTFVAWTGAAIGGASVNSGSCTTTATDITCDFYRRCTPVLVIFCAAADVPFTLTASAANVGMALRTLNDAAAMTNVNAAPRSSSGVLNNDGSATITFNGEAAASGGLASAASLATVFAACCWSAVQAGNDRGADPPARRPSGPRFRRRELQLVLRNNWHQVSYYAVAPDIAPSGARACGANCLTVGFRNPGANQRGLLVIAGRNLTGRNWPDAATTAADWLEATNNNGDVSYAVRDPALMVRRTFNDRIAVIDP
jgi:hypothetical protein